MAICKFYKNIVSEDRDLISFMLTEISSVKVNFKRDIDRRKERFEFELLIDLYPSENSLVDIVSANLDNYKEIRFRTKYADDKDPENEFVITSKDFNVKHYFDYASQVNRYFGMLINADELKVFNKGEDIICFTIVFNSKLRN